MSIRRAIVVPALAAIGLLAGGAQGLGAREPAALNAYTYERSGIVTINGDGEQARLHVTNGSEKAWTAELTLFNASGKVLATKTVNIDPGKTANLTTDPTITTALRAYVVVSGVEDPCIVPSLEVLTTGGGGHVRTVLDAFHEEVVPAS